ncbi:MAG: tetratricopeptide repeat protein [Tenuifilaceae bacterium]|nr:tetratricopeptide repeat protein [Tenuifilaceae bacterium]
MKRFYSLALLFVIITAGVGFAESTPTKADSLINLFVKAKSDSVRARILFEMGDELRGVDTDSSLSLYNKAWEFAKKSKLDTIPYARWKANALREIGLAFRKQGRFDEALALHEEVQVIYQVLNDTLRVAQCLVNKGNIHYNWGNYDVSLQNYFDALRSYEAIGNVIGIADCQNNIGSVYKEMEDFDKALEHHFASAKLFEDLLASPKPASDLVTIKRGLSYCYNNIGVAYWNLNDNRKAIEYYQKSLNLKNDIEDKNGVAQGYNNIAIVFATDEDYTGAIAFFKKALEVYMQTGHMNGLTMVNGNVAYLYILLADNEQNANSSRRYLQTALEYAQKSISIAKEIGATPYLLEATGYLKLIYFKLGNFAQAYEAATQFIDIQKEMFNKDKANALAEASTRYENEKKQLVIESMQKENHLFERQILLQRLIIVSVSVLLLLTIVLSLVLIRYTRQKKEANSKLSQHNEEILQQKEEIIAQLDEIDAQKSEIEQLYIIALERKNILEKQRDNIDDSIRYAKFIQSAVLPDLKSVYKEVGIDDSSYFIMYRPKDVVSGDFYWATHKDDWLISTVADCTGHGVPGSLMSMLGMSLLKEIVLKNNVVNPAEILEELRSNIIDSLRQTDEGRGQRDGMDMSIIAYNVKNNSCLWAGANIPLWIVRRTPQVYSIDSPLSFVEEIKPDFMPVAAHINMKPFTSHNIDLMSGDRLFLFSDGYGDQFGGPEGKKFNMYSALKRLISQTSSLPMVEQGKEIESNFDTWITFGGNRYEQIDDVTILGIMV